MEINEDAYNELKKEFEEYKLISTDYEHELEKNNEELIEKNNKLSKELESKNDKLSDIKQNFEHKLKELQDSNANLRSINNELIENNKKLKKEIINYEIISESTLAEKREKENIINKLESKIDNLIEKIAFIETDKDIIIENNKEEIKNLRQAIADNEEENDILKLNINKNNDEKVLLLKKSVFSYGVNSINPGVIVKNSIININNNLKSKHISDLKMIRNDLENSKKDEKYGDRFLSRTKVVNKLADYKSKYFESNREISNDSIRKDNKFYNKFKNIFTGNKKKVGLSNKTNDNIKKNDKDWFNNVITKIDNKLNNIRNSMVKTNLK